MLLGAVLVVQSDSSRREGPTIPLLHTLVVYQSGLLLRELPSAVKVTCRQWDAVITACPPSCSLPPPALDQESIPGWNWHSSYKFIKSPTACCRDAAAPADYSIENGWCHHRVIERSQECQLHSKGPEIPQQMKSALTLLVCCCSVISPGQFIVHVNSQVLVRCHHLNVCSQYVCVQGCLCLRKSTTSSLVFPALSWRWFRWHQSTKSWISSL